MNLNVILPIKKITIDGIEISLPKLGLKHHNLMKEVKMPDENLAILLDSIKPGLDAVQSDIVLLQLLAFNGKIKEEAEKDGFTYRLSDVYGCRILTHRLNGQEYKFNAPERFSKFGSADAILDKYFSSVDGRTEKPDFMKLPAFVIKWVDGIVNTVAIPGPNGPIKGIGNIIGLFE